MKAIDDALPAAKLGAAKMSEVKKLRADSMATLGKAKTLLGIK